MLTRIFYCTLLVLMLLSVTLPSPVFAQDSCEGTVFATAPVRLIHGELTLPEGNVMHFSVREGELLLVRGLLDSSNETVALQVSGSEEAGFSVRRFGSISEVPEHPEFVDQGSVRLRPHVSESAILGDLSIKILGTEWRSMDTPPMSTPGRLEGEEALRNVAAGSCCVTCGSVTACGCAVSHSCGSCCSDPCCGGSGGSGGSGGPIREHNP